MNVKQTCVQVTYSPHGEYNNIHTFTVTSAAANTPHKQTELDGNMYATGNVSSTCTASIIKYYNS